MGHLPLALKSGRQYSPVGDQQLFVIETTKWNVVIFKEYLDMLQEMERENRHATDPTQNHELEQMHRLLVALGKSYMAIMFQAVQTLAVIIQQYVLDITIRKMVNSYDLGKLSFAESNHLANTLAETRPYCIVSK